MNPDEAMTPNLDRATDADFIRRREARADTPAAVLVLMGPTGRLLARLLPGALPSPTDLSIEPALKPARLAVITDDQPSAERLACAGHDVALIADAHQNQTAPGLGRKLFEAFFTLLGDAPVRAVLFTPEVAQAGPEISLFTRRLWRTLHECGRLPAMVTPSFICGDVHMDFTAPLLLIRNLNKRVKPGDFHLNLVFFGSRRLFDYERLLKNNTGLTTHPLGWRLPPESPIAEPERTTYVWLQSLASRRDLLREWLPRAARLGVHKVVVYAPDGSAHYVGPGMENVEVISEELAFRDRALGGQGLILADGDADLLPALSAGCRVALVRNGSPSATALIRIVYFEGQGRWPVFERSRELVEALSAQGLDGFWAPYASRRCSLEQEPDLNGFQENVAQFLGLQATRD